MEGAARAVVERLRAERRREGWRWMRPTWVRIAAALALLIGGALVARGTFRPRVVIPSGADLSGLSAAQLQELLAGLDQTLSGSASDTLDDLDGLTEEQLRAVIESLEG